MSEDLAKKESSTSLHPIFGIPLDRMPRHVAIIMDGNGRWAQERGLPRIEGHRNGSKGVRTVITESARLGFECLTLYSFSTENWKRPKDEVDALMDLYAQYLIDERPTIMNNHIRVRHIGKKDELPDHVREALGETIEMSKGNGGMTLFLALNYSGRSEIVGAVETITRKVLSGKLNPEAIDESLLSDHLDTGGFPDPDLLIRTSGEHRISNFLLWQIAYAELFVTDVHWPDFTAEVLSEAVKEYARRHRRYGGL
jgi:undecaprenyl diphosphate synthase